MSEVSVDINSEVVSEDKVLATVVNGIKYTFFKDVMVKPLAIKMISKEVVTQVPTKEVDEDGFNKYETVTEVKEVESSYGTGIVLSIPDGLETPFTVGDTVVYNRRHAIDFDLFKDSQLIKPYDIIAIVKD
jgi:hypothetical protein